MTQILMLVRAEERKPNVRKIQSHLKIALERII
jgi:hypothetical protein